MSPPDRPPHDRPPPRRGQSRRPVTTPAVGHVPLRRLLVAGVAVLLVAMWGLFGLTTAQQFDLARDSAQSDTATVAKLVDAWAQSSLARVDYLAGTVEAMLDFDPTPADLNALLARQQAADPDLFPVIEVRDSTYGFIASSNPDFPIESARNFDSDLPAKTASEIGLPRVVGDDLLIPVRQALHDSAGVKRGIVVVEIAPFYFGGFSADLGLPAGAAVVMLREDGPLLVRGPDDQNMVGDSYRDSALWRALQEAPTGSFHALDRDRVERITSYRLSDTLPLAVAVGFATDQVFAATRQRAVENGLAGALLSALLIAGTAYLVRQIGRRATAEAQAGIARAAVQSVGSGVAVVVVDEQRRIVLANPALGRLLGRPPDALTGCPLADVAAPQLVAAFADDDWLDSASGSAAGESVREVALTMPDGTEIWVEVRLAPIPERFGLTHHAVLVLTDRTESRQAEQALIEARDQAEASSRSKSEFLANMSHELRTPLNAVIGFAEVIAGEVFGPVGTPRYREYAEDIHQSGSHLLRIISDILDLAKIEANRVVLDEEPVDVATTLAMCARLIAGRAEEAGVAIKVEAADDLPRLMADELRVKQVVLNLLSNAVKFSPEAGTVRLAARLTHDGGLVVEVHDNGPGMTAEQAVLAMEPFRQVNGMVAVSREGTGLGLPLATRLMALHDGRLVIASTPGVGTTVEARFPAARVVRRRAAA
ncbi:MAG: ATP-binding protein [Alphaproteobacteria bacterium]